MFPTIDATALKTSTTPKAQPTSGTGVWIAIWVMRIVNRTLCAVESINNTSTSFVLNSSKVNEAVARIFQTINRVTNEEV